MEKKRFGDIADFVNGMPFRPKDWGTKGLPIIRIQNLTETSGIFNYYEGEFDERYLVRNDDILISWSASLGVYRWDKQDAVLNQHIFKVNLKNGINKTFFYYAVQSKLIEMERQVHGSTMKHITKGKFDDLKIPLPDLSTQKKISSILEQADAARQKRKQANQLTGQFLQSAFLEMFGDLSTNEKGWQVTLLGEVCGFVRGPFGGSLKKEIFKENGYAVYEQSHAIYNQFNEIRYFIDDDKFKEMKRFELNAGDLIMSCSGTMGKVAIVPSNIKRGIINQALLKLTPSQKILNVFLKFWMESKNFQSDLKMYSQGAAIQNVVSVKVLKEIKLPLPPLPLQIKFASLVERVEKLQEKQRESERELENLFQSLMQRYFGNYT
ncbi:MAG: restriction endonuclease subunit S [Bacteroidetes bacterium]|nr:restriction endonuclease subunit S [Bacteroidota bacterium]